MRWPGIIWLRVGICEAVVLYQLCEWHTRHAMYVLWRNIEALSCNHCCSGKAIIITYSVCVCRLMYSAYSARERIVICVPPGSTGVFHIISWTAQFSGEKMIEHEMYVLIFSTRLYKVFLILRRNEQDIIKKCVLVFNVKCPFFMSEWNWNFLARFSRSATISNLVKILSVGAELYHVDRRTDRHDEANSRFSQFLNAPIKQYLPYFFNCSYV